MTAHARTIRSEDAARIDADRDNVRISIRYGLSSSRAEVELAVECVLNLRSYMWQRGLWADWSRDVEAAIVACDGQGLTLYAARLRAYLAGLHEACGNWKEVLQLSKRVLESANDAEALRDALFHRATALHNLGSLRKALRAYAKARDLSSDSLRRAAIDHKVSRVLKALGKRDSAEAHLEKALEAARIARDQWFYAELLLDKVGYLGGTEFEAALKLAQESLSIYSGLGFLRGVAFAETQCGRLHALLGDDRRSNDYFERALRRFRRESYRPGQSHAHFFRGLVRLLRGAAQASHEDFLEACTAARLVNYRRMLVAATSGALLAALRGRIKIAETALLVFRTRDWWKVLSLALQFQVRGIEAVLKEGMRA